MQADMECTVGGCSRLGLTPFQCALAALDEGRRDSFARHIRAEGLDIDFDPNPRVGKSLLHEALRRGEDRSVQELLSRGASVHLDKTASKLSPIHLAVKPGSGISDETIKQMLLRLVTVGCLRNHAFVHRFKVGSQSVNAFDQFGRTPLTVAVEGGLARLATLKLLLDRGAEPNLQPLGGGESALEVARKAHCQEVIDLLETFLNKNGKKTENGASQPTWSEMDRIAQNGNAEELAAFLSQPGCKPSDKTLRYVLLKEQEGLGDVSRDYSACLDIILNHLELSRQNGGAEEVRDLINHQDGQGSSSLHLATQLWGEDVVARLLRLGANVGLENQWRELPITSILPATLESFLDSTCLSATENPTNLKYEITMDYTFLAPPSIQADTETGQQQGLLEANHELVRLNGGQEISPDKKDKKQFQAVETAALYALAQSKNHRHLLQHPVVSSFLALKWSRISRLYNINIIFTFVLVLLLSAFVFTINTFSSIAYLKKVLHMLLIILWSLLIGREATQLMAVPVKYFKSLENFLELFQIIIIGCVLFLPCDETDDANRRGSSGVVLLISWFELLLMVGRHPFFHSYNIYSTMFFSVLKTFFTFFVWYSLFIVAFGLSFYILLGPCEGNNCENPFERPELSIVKVFAMFTGELEFSNISFNSSPVLGYLVFLLFLFLIVIVLMNLLTGLAVGETSKIRDEAEVWAQRCRVETIFHLETCLVSLSAWMPSFIHPRLFSMSGHLLLPSGQSSLPHCLTVQPNARGKIPCCQSKTLPLPRPLSAIARALISCFPSNPVQVISKKQS